MKIIPNLWMLFMDGPHPTWLQRKKIGLSRKTRRSIENVKRSNQREADAIKFIRGSFQRRKDRYSHYQ